MEESQSLFRIQQHKSLSGLTSGERQSELRHWRILELNGTWRAGGCEDTKRPTTEEPTAQMVAYIAYVGVGQTTTVATVGGGGV